jgi:uncharacterized protein YaiI (UPF0178 family)
MPGPRRWLVDGMNVIGSRPDRWWRDRAGAFRRLRGQLVALARSSGDEVVLVLDGRRPSDWPADAGIVTAFASGGRGAADDEIVARLAADGRPETVTVVTSDRELADRARELGADVVGAAGFRRRIERGG